MTTYVTTWTMPQDDVNLVSSAGQWNSWALQVDGSNNPVTWVSQTPMQVISITMVEEYGAFISSETDFPDGTVLKSISRYPVKLGSAYSWTGSNLIIDTFNDCDKSSVKLTNNSSGAWTFGLTKLDPKTKQQQPICADMVLQKQPVTYTPILTMYAKVGRTYKTSSIIADIGSWAKFQITSVDADFIFNHDSTQWAV